MVQSLRFLLVFLLVQRLRTPQTKGKRWSALQLAVELQGALCFDADGRAAGCCSVSSSEQRPSKTQQHSVLSKDLLEAARQLGSGCLSGLFACSEEPFEMVREPKTGTRASGFAEGNKPDDEPDRNQTNKMDFFGKHHSRQPAILLFGLETSLDGVLVCRRAKHLSCWWVFLWFFCLASSSQQDSTMLFLSSPSSSFSSPASCLSTTSCWSLLHLDSPSWRDGVWPVRKEDSLVLLAPPLLQSVERMVCGVELFCCQTSKLHRSACCMLSLCLLCRDDQERRRVQQDAGDVSDSSLIGCWASDRFDSVLFQSHSTKEKPSKTRSVGFDACWGVEGS